MLLRQKEIKICIQVQILLTSHKFVLILATSNTMIMKKIYLLTGAIIASTSLFAQRLANTPMVAAAKSTNSVSLKGNKIVPMKAEGDLVWSNNFGTATDWVHVSGPNQTPGSVGQWQILNAVPATLVAQGFNSTIQSASGPSFGFIDSDGAGAGKVQDAYLEYTGTIDLSALAPGTPLYLEFTEYYRHYQEENFIEVSVDGGTTWTTYQVNPVSEVPVNTNSLVPEFQIVNITSANAAGSATVKVRFHYVGTYDWFWGVDDIKITEAYQNDGKMVRSIMTSDPANSQGCDYYMIPDNQLAEFPGHEFITIAENMGAATQTNFRVRATEPVSSYNELSAAGVTYGNSLATGVADTFKITTAFNPAASATPYNVTISVDLGLTDANNANDTTSFRGIKVGGTEFARDNNVLSGGITSFGGTGNEIIGWFNYMNIFATYSVGSVKTYIPQTQAAGFTTDDVYASIEQYNGTTFDEVFVTPTYSVTSADFGKWLSLSSDVTDLEPGLYRVVFHRSENGANTLRIGMAQACPEGTVGGIKQSDLTTIGLADPNALMIRLSPISYLGTNEIDADPFGLNVYPNPANDQANVTFSLVNDAAVVVTVTDLAGKVVYTSNEGNNAAGTHSLTINTSSFSNGVYMVNFSANNEVSTQKLVIRK